LNIVTTEKENLTGELGIAKTALNESNNRIEYFKKALNEIYTLIEGLVNSEGTINPTFTPIMKTLEDLQKDITIILERGGSDVRVGGRRKRLRKHTTKKIKRGMKKRIIMKGGFYIGDYENDKPKTYHRRHKNKKSTSTRRRKKHRYTTTTSTGSRKRTSSSY
jgi:hypothetical protein